ncbi:hypothetical protein ACFVZ4_20300 [Streptomyces goshikiensis]|uniref:hypothetical protein n=1 Tax=Streptomyces goshikiensis TaxID=1942 RepID=UPI00369E00EA
MVKEKAGPYWENLKADVRFQGFWKAVSIRACEAISSSASALASRLQGDLPTAALLRLSETTLTYSTAAADEPAPSPTPAPEQAGAPTVNSSMGQELASSSHRRVTAFRAAWQQLPPHESGPGQAVGPYGDVAERAKALVTAAVGSARFAPGDLRALQALARTADIHAARLSVTLPPGTAAPAQRVAAPAPRVAAPTAPAARTPRASA